MFPAPPCQEASLRDGGWAGCKVCPETGINSQRLVCMCFCTCVSACEYMRIFVTSISVREHVCIHVCLCVLTCI